MNKAIIVFLFVFTCAHVAFAQRKHNNTMNPGLSYSYLPTWILDDYHGNVRANVFTFSLNAHREIWKESVLVFGLGYGKISVLPEKYSGIMVPLKLQKYFNRERKGFNLSVGMLWNYCKNCDELIAAAFSHDVSYSFLGNPFELTVGLQLLEGGLFADTAIHLGGQVQVVYRPKTEKSN